MGRAASHVTLSALQTHRTSPDLEDVQGQRAPRSPRLSTTSSISGEGAAAGKNYGVLLVPEGLVEFIPDFKVMIDELSTILGRDESTCAACRTIPSACTLNTQLSAESAQVHNSLPAPIQDVLLTRDSRQRSPLPGGDGAPADRPRLDKIRLMKARGETNAKFSPLALLRV